MWLYSVVVVVAPVHIQRALLMVNVVGGGGGFCDVLRNWRLGVCVCAYMCLRVGGSVRTVSVYYIR